MRLIGENMVVGIKDAAKHCWADTDFSHISAFDFSAMCLSLTAFTFLYESVMYVYAKKIKKISVKEIMTE